MELTSPTYVAKETVQTVQDYVLFCVQAIGNLFQKPFYFTDMVTQADAIGVGSLPIVVLTGFFTGAVLALQASNTLERFGSLSLVGQLVSTSMVRELGPVLTSLMVAGRNSSGMASELGSMVVTEQIDAMRALGTDPMKKLVTPRMAATVFMLFFLAIVSDLVGLAGEGGSPEFFCTWIRGSIGPMPGKRWCFKTCLWGWSSRFCLASSLRRSAVSME